MGALVLVVVSVALCGTAQAAVQPAKGTFSGTQNQGGIVSSWHGQARFATPLAGGTGITLAPTSGSVTWSVSGTSLNGCSYSGSGHFAFLAGKLLGHKVGGYAGINDDDTYSLSLLTGANGLIPGYNAFPVTVSCPKEKPYTTPYVLGSWLDTANAHAPLKIHNGQLIGTGGFTAGPFYSQSYAWNFSYQRCPSPNVKTGNGYADLTDVMKAHLNGLYSILDEQHACYHFNIGYRSEAVQKGLYDSWHEIADGHKSEDPTELCDKLKDAGFAQCPTGWRADGTARGGPAKPGTSRHEVGEAADIRVTWPPTYQKNLTKFRAAAHEAGLCGPPASDPVHVELPYRKIGQTTATCHFG